MAPDDSFWWNSPEMTASLRVPRSQYSMTVGDGRGGV
jgi:hypothetical protein